MIRTAVQGVPEQKGIHGMTSGDLAEHNILDELVTGILDIMEEQIHEIVLYGSVARGTDGPDSDVDIALIISRELSPETQRRLSELIADMDLKYDRVFSVIDIELQVFTKWQKAVPFYRNVRDEGVILWKAA